MTLLVALLFAGCVLTGVGLTGAAGPGLRLEERVAFGAVVGAMAAVIGVFVAGQIVGFGATAVWAGTGGALAVAVAVGWPGRRDLVAEWPEFVRRVRAPWRDPDSLVPLWLVLAAAWPAAVRILSLAYRTGPDGAVQAGHLSVFGDWQAHLAYAGSFAYGDGLDLDLPVAAGEDFSYHFGVDLFAAMLEPLGASLPTALAVTSGYLALAFPAVMYLAGLRIMGRRGAAAGGVILFTMAGGWGFVRFFDDWVDRGRQVIWDLPRDYTRDFDTYWMDNPVLGHLYPQRPTLFGFSVALIAAAVLHTARRSGDHRPFLFVGVLVGLTPMFHTFGWGTALVLGLIWAALDRRREWIWFVVPAVGLSLPAILFLLPPDSSFRWNWGWVAGDWPHEIAWFWVLNTGLFAPLLIIAQLRRDLVPRAAAVAFAPLWLWFIGAHLALPHPWDGNNSKYIVFWWMFGSFFVAALLVEVARRAPVGRVAAGVIALSLVAAGGLDLFKALDGTDTVYPTPVMSAGDVLVAEWARDRTEPDAVFVASPSNTGVGVSSLGGRQVVTGFSGWVFDLGIPTWAERADASRRILSGADDADVLVDRWDVDYVVIGPTERRVESADPTFWAARATLVYDFGGFTVYETNRRP